MKKLKYFILLTIFSFNLAYADEGDKPFMSFDVGLSDILLRGDYGLGFAFRLPLGEIF